MNKFLRFIAVVSLFTFAACTTDSTDYESQILDLADRIESLERVESYVNNQIEALTLLREYSNASGSLGTISISSITESNGAYSITFSNGRTIEVASSYDAPQTDMRVVDGYWQYSIDGGATWTDVVDENGLKVEATDTGDACFATIDVVDGALVFTLVGDDTEYSIPIITGFTLAISGVDPTEAIPFSYGEVQTFEVTVEGASAVAVLACPEGWSASYASGLLTVTAPETEVTRSLTADSTSDIALMAISESGFTAISKFMVSLDPYAEKNPAATVAAQEVDQFYGLVFDVSLTQTTSWYYIFQASSLAAPTEAELKATTEQSTAITGTSVSLPFSELAMGTSYTLYVLPIYEGVPSDVTGSIVSAEATTLTFSIDLLDYYTHGYTADNGITYSSENGTLIEGTATISEDGVYFLDADANVTLDGSSAFTNLVIIGRKPLDKPSMTIVTNISVNAGNGIIFKNLNIQMTHPTAATYIFKFGSDADAVSEYLIVEDCYLSSDAEKGISYYSGTNCAVSHNIWRNNMIKINATSANGLRIVAYASSLNADEMKSFDFTNNIVFVSGGSYSTGSVLFFAAAIADVYPSYTVNIANNTFVNFAATTAFVAVPTCSSMVFTDNIFWADSSIAATCVVFKYTVQTTAPATLDVANNVFYGLDSTKNYTLYSSGSTYGYDSSSNIITKESTSPLAVDLTNETFIQADGYTSMGATITNW